MDTGWHVYRRTCGTLTGIWLAGLALASPPAAGPAWSSHGESARSGAERQQSIKLDLRAPLSLSAPDGERPALRNESPPGSFHAARLGVPMHPSLEESRLDLGTNAIPISTRSRAEELARRFQHQGLPVVRLFENHAALVSLGLNQHGKPGIWLIQKLP